MGIQGLLPLLKPIHRHRKVSEFAGQTLAVDAYVWLHRGAFACAPELVKGKPTRKYVDYCMHRVRFLRYHGIDPYLVFDGGPLPAKAGTEKEREKKRKEAISKAKQLEAQGKHAQARELYTKCVDVSPQMAYQVIKALKSENVKYIVAPYEADAQMAYLERVGIVNGIITEDSDLLVFGCRTVLFKLDIVQSTVVCISRDDFGSPSLFSEADYPISFVGWSDAQFRWMAMLSGCDYLPSIPGIGLKTAYQLLKKHKSVERAVKMIHLDGKKEVPRGYMDAFVLAEKVFLHQRVFDPRLQKLVHLSGQDQNLDLSEDAELYIGRSFSDDLAKSIAEGYCCPITHSCMEDINVGFNPGNTPNKLPLRERDSNTLAISPEPSRQPPAKPKQGLLNFFTPVKKSPANSKIVQNSIETKAIKPAKAIPSSGSGKRTLVEAMEYDIELKRKRLSLATNSNNPRGTTSKFFSETNDIHSASSSLSDISAKEIVDACETFSYDFDEVDSDPVEQEDGYHSPSPCFSRNITPDLSSPLTRRFHDTAARIASRDREVEDSADTSPSFAGLQATITKSALSLPDREQERIFVRGSSEPVENDSHPIPIDTNIPGPDLRDNFGSDDDVAEDDDIQCSTRLALADQETRCLPSPVSTATPPAATRRNSRTNSLNSLEDGVDIEELGEIDETIDSTARAKVVNGWMAKFAFVGGPRTPVAKSVQTGSRRTRSLQNTDRVQVVHSSERAYSFSESKGRHDRNKRATGKIEAESLSVSKKLGSRNAPILLDIEEAGDLRTNGNLSSFRFKPYM